jgi:DNA-directed RNA polymerase specialized sigma24 family protein
MQNSPPYPWIWAYVNTIVRTTWLLLARRAARRQAREDQIASETMAVVPPANPGSRLDVERILARLDETCRNLLVQVFLYGSSYREIAAETGLAESSIRSKVSRCIGRARALSA